MIPSTRDEFKEYCLRALGKPVIDINVDDDQVEDRIDQAIKFYWDYHYDGTELMYYKHQVTAETIANKYIDLPENIIGVVKIFDLGGSAISSGGMFNIRYQIALNDMYTLTNVSMVPYYQMVHERLDLIKEMLSGSPIIRYNRHRNRLHIDQDATDLIEGSYIIVQSYQVVDPEEFSDVWGDRWLAEYATQLIKRQWGGNLSKFEGLQLPGGVTFNGQKIYDDADAKIKDMEETMINDYSLPVLDMIG
jgi:hypothetical protein